MRLVTFELNGETRVGRVDPSGETITAIAVGDMTELISSYDVKSLASAPMGQSLPLAAVSLLAPIVPKRNIFCVGKNYDEHAREFARSGYEAGAVKGQEIDEFPAVFSKPFSSIVGPGATVDLHPGATQKVDYEAELAVIIGKPGRDIGRALAYEHVWGYTIINDVTARDRQRNHKQWYLGKALDTFCPMGPWIITADEVDPENLQVRCWVNGELRQDANTRDLIFDIPSIIETISAGITLLPGDVIATGTPAGVGIGLDPPRFLKPGDTVTIEIPPIGKLVNTFA